MFSVRFRSRLHTSSPSIQAINYRRTRKRIRSGHRNTSHFTLTPVARIATRLSLIGFIGLGPATFTSLERPADSVATSSTTSTTLALPNTPFPFGIVNGAEPSGMGPPSSSALPGFVQTYVSDFLGTRVPNGWNVFDGMPGGDPGAHFGRSHVKVGGGLLQLLVYRDPHWHNKWVIGGLCHCGHPMRYGAFFVRSRLTGDGANQAELLWPISNRWPPEIDFSENGGRLNDMSFSVHYGAVNHIFQEAQRINMSRWHTWGVVWTRSKVTFVVDGHAWGKDVVASQIPTIPMRLDLEQRTKCDIDKLCPTHSEAMLVDWVAEYSLN